MPKVRNYLRPEPIIPGRKTDYQVGQLSSPTDIRTYKILQNLGSFTLESLTDVAVTSITSGQNLQWNGTSWVNATPPTAGNQTTEAAYGSRPGFGNAGNLFYPTDGFDVERDTGGAWHGWGPIFPFTLPVVGNFSWVNQDTGTQEATHGGLTIIQNTYTAPGHGAAILGMAAPSTPYKVYTHILHNVITSGPGFSLGICMIDSANTKMVTLNVTGNTLVVEKWNAWSPSAPYTSVTSWPVEWFGMGDDGTNITWYLSRDGQHWSKFFSAARHDYLVAGPDKVGFYVYAADLSGSGIDTVYANLMHWKQS